MSILDIHCQMPRQPGAIACARSLRIIDALNEFAVTIGQHNVNPIACPVPSTVLHNAKLSVDVIRLITSLRFYFAFFRLDERYGDVSTVTNLPFGGKVVVLISHLRGTRQS